MFDLNSYLHEKKLLLESSLCISLEAKDIPEHLQKAMRYSLEAGGKRLRPILAFAAASALGCDEKKVLPLAVAFEMIHTFSLIHDDLPAMDNDDLRRGKPTCHKVFGEATAILAGDALLAEAFSVLCALKRKVSSDVLVEVMSDLADATGARGMTGGQQYDMDCTGKHASEEVLETIHRHKTGKLLVAPLCCSAKLCGASVEKIQALQNYGEAVGLAFQIADDILDVEGDEALIGKKVGSDQGNDKLTYPALLGMKAAKEKAATLIQDAIAALQCFDKKAEPLRALAHYIVERKK